MVPARGGGDKDGTLKTRMVMMILKMMVPDHHNERCQLLFTARPISTTMASLDDTPRYLAISYVWGEFETLYPIIIDRKRHLLAETSYRRS